MSQVASLITPIDALWRVESVVDLANVRLKLSDPVEGKGYGSERLDLMEGEYRKFLALHLAFPEMNVVPCGVVDEMWHQHILDTRAYASDCDALFGEMLHHYPYFGMNGPDDARSLRDAYADTLDRYREAFGEPPDSTWISDDAASCKRTNCKPQKCR